MRSAAFWLPCESSLARRLVAIYACVAVFMATTTTLGGEERIRGTNTHYDTGDWISYTLLRYVNAIAVGDLYVYFATTGGIGRYDRYRNQWEYPWTVSNGLADNYITAVGYDIESGYVWCTGRMAVSYMHPASQVWSNVFYDEIGLPTEDSYTSIGFDSRSVWLATERDRLFLSDKYFVNFTSSPDAPDDVRWFGKNAHRTGELPTLFTDADIFFDERGFLRDHKLRTFAITCYTDDPWRNLWIGTWGMGVGRGDRITSHLTMLPVGLTQRAAGGIAKQTDEMWVGGISSESEFSGVTRWNGRDGWDYFEARYIIDFYSDEVNAITIDGDEVWVATTQGLVLYNKKKDSWRHFGRHELLPDERVFDVVVDSQSVWVATAGGVTRYDRGSLASDSLNAELVQWSALRNVEIYDLEMMENLLWMGTEYGIYIYDTVKQGGGFYSGPEGAFDLQITAVSRYEDEVWFGTTDGVEAFDAKRGEWLSSPARRFGTGRAINRIVAARDAVWASTNRGVVKYDRTRKYWRVFTMLDGLVSDEVQTIVLDGDYIWFGTRGGLTRFYWNSPYRID